jgi:DNA polymerase III alpha subunit (gram-positive type)
LTHLLGLLSEARAADQLLVAHNGITFDLPVISQHFKRFLKLDYLFLPDETWDTGAMEKGSQLDEILCLGEAPADFAYRVITRTGDGVHWSLHEHAIQKYGLAERFKLDLEMAHTAPFDAYVTHLLFEEFRRLADEGLANCRDD